MKHLIVPAFAVVALTAAVAAAVVWRSSTKLSAETGAMPSLQELHTASGAKKLPNQEIEDQSLIFPNATKR